MTGKHYNWHRRWTADPLARANAPCTFLRRQAEANITLIAAEHDLLLAARDYAYRYGLDQSADPVARALCAAIAKATAGE